MFCSSMSHTIVNVALLDNFFSDHLVLIVRQLIYGEIL
jgi:hypothetical protein